MKELDIILKSIKDKKYNNIYFLQGDEEYFLDLIIKTFEKNTLKENEKCFDETIIYGRDIEMSTLLEYARKSPMLAQRQLIIIKEAQEITDISRETGKKLFLNYVENPNPRTILVLVYKNKTLDKRTTFGKIISKKTTILTFKKLYDSQISAWIIDYVNQNNLNITDKAIHMIHEYFGNNLKNIANEISKIKNNISDTLTIDDNIVEKYMGINRYFNGFELQAAIGEKDYDKIFTILKYFEQNPKACPIIPMISIIYTFFLKILQIHCSKNKSKQYLSGLLKVNAYFMDDYLKATKKYSAEKILKIISFLHEADLKSKGIDAPATTDSEIAKELICKILM